MRSVRDAKCIAVSADGLAAEFLASARDPVFWKHANQLFHLVEPAFKASQWITGCECHTAERKRGEHVDCKWAGCRCLTFARRIDTLLEDLTDLRDELLAPTDSEIIHAIVRMAADLRLKFSWVSEAPWTSWQARRNAERWLVGGMSASDWDEAGGGRGRWEVGNARGS